MGNMLTTRETASEVAKRQNRNVHNLTLLYELGSRAVVVIFPERFGLWRINGYQVCFRILLTLLPMLLSHVSNVMTVEGPLDVLDSHQTDTRKERHGQEELPELDFTEHCQSSNVWLM
jgi:hypothetical protein